MTLVHRDGDEANVVAPDAEGAAVVVVVELFPWSLAASPPANIYYRYYFIDNFNKLIDPT